MSTRSGKRIHKSLHENIIQKDNDCDLNGERKTRGRRLKENLDNLNISLPKLRKNYVQYPSTEEELEREVLEVKTSRSLRNQTLKEIKNEEILLTNSDESIINQKPIRATRKTKKFAEENIIIENIKEIEEVQTKKNKKPKKQKVNELNEETVEEKENVNQGLDPFNEKQTKKKNRKGNKRSEKTVNKTHSLNNTASSLDSFHSASGSPLKSESDNIEKRNIKLKAEHNVEKHFDVGEPQSTQSQNKSKKTKKGGKNKSKIKTAEVTIDVLDAKVIDQAENNGTEKKLNGTFDVESNNLQLIPEKDRKSLTEKDSFSIKPLDSTFDKEINVNLTFDKENNAINTTFDKDNNIINTTFDKDNNIINTTFDKNSNSDPNLTFDKSNDSIPKINISSDKSSENILNTTPVLIESSMDCTKTPEDNQEIVTRSKITPLTPLKREGTFTKDGPDPIFIMSPLPKVLNNLTPSKRKSLPSPGCTPYHSGTKIDKKNKSALNHTHSVEKPKRRSSLEPTRTTKVMFCSPMNNTMLTSQRKSRVIKSSMKGSSKSFVYDDIGGKSSRLSRKRSFTANDCDEPRSSSKRTKLADDLQESVDRLSRPRTSSATNKVPSTTPVKKPVTPAKSKSDGKSRSKLPNFAALHQKQFAKMESLDECQERKAKRAQRLLVPTGGIAVLERSSPKVLQDPKSVTKEDQNKKSLIVTKSLTDTKQYTRFGFKLNLDVNPFSIPTTSTKEKREKAEKQPTRKDEKQPMPKHTNFLKRSVTQYHIKKVNKNPLPSTAGATALRKDEAKQVIMREKTNNTLKEKSVSKRLENRTIIKGVRTNRRFELQMLSRNIE